MKPCDQPLKSNPFTTYRDPNTGKWIVVIPETKKEPTPAQQTQPLIPKQSYLELAPKPAQAVVS